MLSPEFKPRFLMIITTSLKKKLHTTKFDVFTKIYTLIASESLITITISCPEKTSSQIYSVNLIHIFIRYVLKYDILT